MKNMNRKNENRGIESKTNSRRTFIKKALYTAPKVLVLGSLLRPTETKAAFGPPPSAPNDF